MDQSESLSLSPPGDGEVAELVKYLRGVKSLHCQRAAELLENPSPALVAPHREIADLVAWLEDHSAECLELDRPEWSEHIAKAARFLHLYLKAAKEPELSDAPEWYSQEEASAWCAGWTAALSRKEADHV